MDVDDYKKIVKDGYGPWLADYMKKLGDPGPALAKFGPAMGAAIGRMAGEAQVPVINAAGTAGGPIEGFCGARTLMEFFVDLMEEPEKYHGKIVTFRGAAARDPKFPKGVFAVGRHIMTCCVEDIQYCWIVSEWEKAAMMENRQWIRVRGKISVQRHKLYKGKGPVLQVESVVLTDAPEQEVATFY